MKIKEDRINFEVERIRLQMNKKEFCRVVGITPKTYNRFLSGDTGIRTQVIVAAVDLFGKSADYLLGREGFYS